MTTVPAANRLAALQRDILIAVAALVVYGAGVEVDGSGGVLRCGLRGVVAGVLLGHFGRARGLCEYVCMSGEGLACVCACGIARVGGQRDWGKCLYGAGWREGLDGEGTCVLGFYR